MVVQVPSLIHETQHILNGVAPGPERSAAIRALVLQAIAMLVVVPLFLFTVLGYGIAVRPAPDGLRAVLGSRLGGAVDGDSRQGGRANEVSNKPLERAGMNRRGENSRRRAGRSAPSRSTHLA
jgi:hypothetical protein